MECRNLTILCVLALALLTVTPGARVEEKAGRNFTFKVLPLLKAKCFACHGDDPARIKGDLNMLTREGLLKGGEYSKKVNKDVIA